MKHRGDEQLITAIFTLSRIIREQSMHGSQAEVHSMLQIKTLGIVAERVNPSMKDIADSLHVLSPSATDIISRLVRDKKLRRVRDAADGRIVRLAITPSGRAALNAGLRQVKKKLTQVFSVLNEKEKDDLAAILEKIIEKNNRQKNKN